MGFNIGPRVLTATGGSVHRIGQHKVHHFPPQHVTDGLVAYFDPMQPACWGLQGNTMNDLVGGMGPGTWDGDQVPRAYNQHSIRLGANASCNFSGSSKFPVLTTLTGEMWLNIRGTSSGGYHVFWQKDGGYSGGMVYGLRATDARAFTSHAFWGSGSGELDMSQSTTTYSQDVWYHVVVRIDETFRLRIFVDGVDASADAGHGSNTLNHKPPYQTSGGGNIGSGDSRNGNFDFGLFRLYDRALSDEEIAQNYNAEKCRFHNYTDNFTPICSGGGGRVEALVVAGGGGGAHGIDNGNGVGGGGAGGLIYNSSVAVTNSATTVTVGTGGTGASVSDTHHAGNGGNSSFGTIIATGGGGGGSSGGGGSINTPNNGGSGGGGGNAAATGISGQGNDGGTYYSASGYYRGGGGGGAGGAGISGEVDAGGGPGLPYSISGSSKFYAGGGGGAGHSGYTVGSHAGAAGGLGGSGIGGRGADGSGSGTTAQPGGQATPDTGSGGGASTWPSSGGTEKMGGCGSNGTVIVRYPAEDYNAECLLVAGGASGGSGSVYAYYGGGGGAGGVLYYSKLSIVSGKNYKVNVGNGGTDITGGTYANTDQAAKTGGAATVTGLVGSQGKNSVFGDKVAIGGGAGGAGYYGNAQSGGCGGGGGGRGGGAGKGHPEQGYDGMYSSNHGDVTTFGAGGGGAGGAPLHVGSNTARSPGGEGLLYSITGVSTSYSYGGNGGGVSSSQANYKADPTTRGSGGRGGNGNGGAGADGYDGLVVIAYKGPQRGTGGVIDQVTRPGYTLHIFKRPGPNLFVA